MNRILRTFVSTLVCICALAPMAHAQSLARQPILAINRPGLLGSYVFAPVPVGLLRWSATDTAPGLTQTAPTSDVAPFNLTLAPQGPYSGAVTNVAPANAVFAFPAAVSGNTYGYLSATWAGATAGFAVAPYPGNKADMLVWGGPAGLVGATTTSNYALLLASTVSSLNVNTGGQSTLQVAGTSQLAVTSSTITFEPGGSSVGTITSSLANFAVPIGAAAAITHPSPQTIACGTGGTQTVASSPTSGLIVTSGTLASNCTIDFGTNATSGDFTLDMSGVTLGSSFGVIFKNGTSSSATFLSTSVITTGDTLAKVWTHGANTLAVQY